jgi:hypothetical protein
MNSQALWKKRRLTTAPLTFSAPQLAFGVSGFFAVAHPPLPLHEFFPLHPLSLDLHPPWPLHAFFPLQSCVPLHESFALHPSLLLQPDFSFASAIFWIFVPAAESLAADALTVIAPA